MLIDREIYDFYDESSEADRLKYGLGPLELERNQELISRYLPESNGTIIDVGGGPGIYASWLAKMGHQVFLIDPVKKHIDQARKKASRLKNPFESILGEAQQLEFQDSYADLVILHGPLYHLQDKEYRIQTLLEAKRVLKPGGIILAFAICHTASTLVGLLQGIISQPDIYQMCVDELQSGLHQAPENMPGVLSKAYYHRPEELKEEIEESGLIYKNTLPVEGMIWLDKNYFNTRSNEKEKAKMMDLLKLTENDPSTLVFSPHIVSIATKT